MKFPKIKTSMPKYEQRILLLGFAGLAQFVFFLFSFNYSIGSQIITALIELGIVSVGFLIYRKGKRESTQRQTVSDTGQQTKEKQFIRWP